MIRQPFEQSALLDWRVNCVAMEVPACQKGAGEKGKTNMAQQFIVAIVAALQHDQRDQYKSLVSTFLKGDAADELWKALGEAHGTAFDVFDRLLAWPTADIAVAIRRLMPAVGHIKLVSLAEAVRFLQFAERVEPSFSHRVSEQLGPHLASQPELGRQLGEALRRGHIMGERAVRVWTRSFSNAAPHQAAEYALDLLAGSGNDLALLAVLLQFLPTGDAAVTSVLQPHEARLSAALVEAAPAVGRDAWFALTAIVGFSPGAMNAIHQAVTAGEVPALIAVADWLYRVSTPTVGATGVPLEELVKDLLRHAVASDEVRGWVDSGVASLLDHGSLRVLILPCVAELGRVDADVVKLFNETFDGVCDKPEDFTKLLTEWLLAENVTFNAIRSLLSRCAAQQAPAGLDSATFAAALPARKVAAVRRLMALTHDGPVLCLFIASLAETPAMQPHGLELAAHMLNEAFQEYPGATMEFLQSRTRPTARKEPFAHVYRGVYANALRWRRVLSRLPQLNELRPTDTQRHALRAMRQRMNRDIMRVAGEHSVFASLVTNVHIAQGRRFASHTVHGAPQVFDMQEASHSVELPSSELADPVGGMLRRAKALGASR